MRAIIQRVNSASVSVNGKEVSSIRKGLLVLVGFHRNDTKTDSDYIISKTIGLRIFDDESGVMNVPVSEIDGEILLVSQFTLYADSRKGRRPSYSESMPPAEASVFYSNFVEKFTGCFENLKSGVFGADMQVKLENSGPVTIILDSSRIL